jgi:hypothetical protein
MLIRKSPLMATRVLPMSTLTYWVYWALGIIVEASVGAGMAESLLWLRPACG